eukprot:TRINITY_DN58378_c0_g1_i1.p1 TRINITY_DN58378_c0_g1~~TRINITY_DN58378_c0_g1_i1.p1  ORF type:complete len:550 (-),score=130.05 TRINITY_DN58378_c0_g1_i1:153-1748(-)
MAARPRRRFGRLPLGSRLLASIAAAVVSVLLLAVSRTGWGCSGGSSAFSALGPGKYRALTKVRQRRGPDVGSEPTGEVVMPGQIFEVEQAVAAEDSSDLSFLKVAGGGWVFDRGIAGRWVGKPIVELVEAFAQADAVVEVSPVPAAAPTAPAAPAAPVAETAEIPEVVEAQPIEPAVALATAGVETVRLPDNMLGAGFEFVRLQVEGVAQPLLFMLGTSFPGNVLTERGKELVGAPGGEFKGGWLSAATAASRVTLKKVQFLGTGASIGDLEDCSVMDFPQAQLAAQLGIEVHGMLGQPFFSSYDIDLDRYRGRLELYEPGQAASQGFYSTVKHLPGLAMGSGNLGIAIKGDIVGDQEPLDSPKQSFIGLLDTSAAFTTINWEAAKLLGFAGPTDPRLMAATKVLGAGPDGQAVEMPVALVRLSLCAVPEGVKPMLAQVSKEKWESSGGKGWYFERLDGGDTSVELGAVNVAIGDSLSLRVLDDTKIGPFTGAAAVVGQDLLFQADRLILNLKDSQLWLQPPGELRDATEM